MKSRQQVFRRYTNQEISNFAFNDTSNSALTKTAKRNEITKTHQQKNIGKQCSKALISSNEVRDNQLKYVKQTR